MCLTLLGGGGGLGRVRQCLTFGQICFSRRPLICSWSHTIYFQILGTQTVKIFVFRNYRMSQTNIYESQIGDGKWEHEKLSLFIGEIRKWLCLITSSSHVTRLKYLCNP